jgi:hypothetical protein
MGASYLSVDRRVVGIERGIGFLHRRASIDQIHAAKKCRLVAACVGVSTAAVYLISVSGQGSSGPLDVVQDSSLLPLLRAIAGFTLGLATFRIAAYLDRLSAIVQDVLVVVILISMLAVAVFTADDLVLY